MCQAKARVRKWKADSGTVAAHLRLNHIGLTQLPPLPDSVHSLACSNNKLTTLGPTLPPQLFRLCCDNNLLTALPPLPPTLRILDCSGNTLLRAILPAGLTYLYACGLRALPPLPAGLYKLQCTNVRRWPPLPDGLRILNVIGSHAFCTRPPVLPPKLEELYVDCASWWELPTLPATLAYLHFSSRMRLCDGYPAWCEHLLYVGQGFILPQEWQHRVRRQHAGDRTRCSPYLPPAALLFM
jgi:hypothetical protein